MSQLLFILPSTIALILINRLFVGKFEIFKLIVTSTIGIFYISLFNIFVYQCSFKNWLNDATKVIFTTLLTFFITRWTHHAVFLKSPMSNNRFSVNHIMIVALSAFCVLECKYSFANSRSLLWGSLPVLIYLWRMCGSFVTNRMYIFLVCLCTSSMYFVFIDSIAFTNVEFIDRKHLPYERLLFDLIMNGIIVLTSFGLDRANAILYTHHKTSPLTEEEKNKMQKFWSDFQLIFSAFHISDNHLNQDYLNDINLCFEYLREISSSFFLSLSIHSNGK